MPRTKIISTLGPASGSYTVLRKMFNAGLDVVRLNFSHGTHKQHFEYINLVRRLNKKYRRRIRIMQDLEGFRIRVGKFKGAKTKLLKSRAVIRLTNVPENAGPKTIVIDYKKDLNSIRAGQMIYIDDGNIILRVKNTTVSTLKTVVVQPGELKQRKGINIPDAELEFERMTEKDKTDIEFGIKHNVDYIALSFVRNEEDVLEAAELVKPRLPKCRIVAKIENKEAIENIDRIIAVSDGIMVARGDMGVSIPIHQVPIVQKRIIKKCNIAGKFVITATQMLESMTQRSRPTRAEVTDVANAIIDGTDFVMLSAETAIGKFPGETVHMMNEIIKFTEKARL